MNFEKLLEPYEIRGVKLRNRMVCPPHSRLFTSPEGYVTETTLATYDALARGGVGMIIVEATCVDFPLGLSAALRQRIDDDKYILGLSNLVQTIHKHSCPVFLQLIHAGPAHKLRHVFGLPCVAASSLSGAERPLPSPDADRALAIAEIEAIVDKFARAAERARKAGFDGVEIHGAQGYLLNSFLSPAWNKRQDTYGGQDVKSRAQFAVEAIRAAKERAGWDFPIGIRINGQEWGWEKVITPEDSRETAKLLQEAGADYISVSGFGYGRYLWITYPEQILYPEPPEDAGALVKLIRKPGLLVSAAAAIKGVVSVPVIASGRLYPELGEWLLREGKVDLIGMVRGLLADPELPNKIASGRLDDITPCMGCVECTGRLARTEPVRCRVNAALGREREYAIQPADRRKRVLVIGGGPAGMEAARVAARRGHEVVLYEKEPRLGGLLPLAALIKGTEIEDMPELVRYYTIQLGKLGVKVKLGKEVTPALIEQIKPDAVILATGGIPAAPEIPGINNGKVVKTSDLCGRVKFFLRFLGPGALGWLTKFWMPVGKRVIVIGGLIAGCQLAEFLVKRGRKVTIVETGTELAVGVPERNKPRLLSWLAGKGVTMLTGVKYEEINDKGLALITKEGKRETIEADTILSAIPFKPNTELFEAVKDKLPEVYLVGDCSEPRKIIDAIDDGMRIGCTV